jgi:hypothetical protein
LPHRERIFLSTDESVARRVSHLSEPGRHRA